MKRFLLFLYCLIFFIIFPAFVVHAEPQAQDPTWISSSSCDGLVCGFGTWGNEGTAGWRDPWQAYFYQITGCCSVFLENTSDPTKGTIIIFSNDQDGLYANVNYAQSGVDADPIYSSFSWQSFSKNSLPNTGMFQGFADYFTFENYDGDYIYYTINNVNYSYRSLNVDYVISDWGELFNQLAEDDFNAGGSNVYPEDKLPFLTYNLKRNIVPNLSLANGLSQEKITFLWDYTEKDPYRSNPTQYTFDIMAWTNFKTVLGTTGFDRDTMDINNTNRVYVSYGGYNIAVNEYSFLYGDIGKAVYNKSGVTWSEDSINSATNGYFLAIRTRTNDSSNTSWWKIFIVQAGGYVFSTDKAVNDNDEIVDIPPDTPSGNDGIGVDSGGIPNYSTDNNNSAAQDTTGDVYSGVDGSAQISLSAVINNLKEVVNSIGQVALLIQSVFLTVPPWLITLIWTSIGLLIAIGVVKHIIG